MLWAGSAAADDPVVIESYETRVIPDCIRDVMPGIGVVCLYDDLEDVKALYRADAEIVMLREVNEALRDKAEIQERMIQEMRRAVAASATALAASKDITRELHEDILVLDKKYQKLRAKPRIGSWVAWATAAVLGAGLLGYVASDLVR